jgi:HD-GYP domain-containing protein (c-di-GMP phosphodiesterase class II)
MRRIILKEARPGMTIARVVGNPTDPASPLAATGEVLTTQRLCQLHQLGLYDVWVTDPGLEFFDDLCSTQPTAAQQRLAVGLREAFLQFSGGIPRAYFKRYGVLLDDLLHALVRAAPSVPCFAALTEDEGLLAHSCNVTALSILLGTQLEGYLVEQRRRLNCRQARDLVNLAMGSLFHDVGELMLPAGQRESRLAISPFEADGEHGEAWKQHTDEGYVLSRGRLDPSAAVVVQHHHERFDGSGFGGTSMQGGGRPQSGTGIHVHARIVMAADVFCQLLFSAGPGAGNGNMPQPMIKALWQLRQPAIRAWFDPVIYDALLNLLPPLVEGMVVSLSDSRQAVVTRVDVALPCHPEVQVVRDLSPAIEGAEQVGQDERINLAEPCGVDLAAVDGVDVGLYLAAAARHEPLVAA